MEEGTLEVLLVNAQGIRHTNLSGKPSYYAILQCGSEERKSKTTKGYDQEAIWNQEFEFEYPMSEWKNVTHLKISIMDEEYFTNGGFVGGAIIFLGGIITEGKDRGYIELHPSPYNVVLEDTTYKGEIKIGFKFRVNVIILTTTCDVKKGIEKREKEGCRLQGQDVICIKVCGDL